MGLFTAGAITPTKAVTIAIRVTEDGR